MSDEPVSGPPKRSATGWRPRFGRLPRTALAGGLAAGLALGGAGLAFAATSSSSSPPSGSTPTTVPAPAGQPRFGGPGGFRAFAGPGGLGAFGGLGGVVHGQVTVRNKNGGYQTVDVQTGKAGPVGSSSITVTSPDGYTHTYVVASSTVVDAQRDGIGSIASGDQVSVVATTVSGKDTATNIADTTKVGASRKGFGFGFGSGKARPARPGPAAAAASFA